MRQEMGSSGPRVFVLGHGFIEFRLDPDGKLFEFSSTEGVFATLEEGLESLGNRIRAIVRDRSNRVGG